MNDGEETDIETRPERLLPASLLSSGRIYVVRVWHEGPAEALVWRALIREGHAGEKKYFARLDDCLEHLYGELSRR